MHTHHRDLQPFSPSALNKTMLHAHRQAWCWQDEWVDLTIDDIRQLEKEAAKELMEKMADAHMEEDRDFATTKNNEIRGLEYQDTPNLSRSLASTMAGNRLREAQMDSVCSDFMTEDVPSSLEETENAVGTMNLSNRRLSKKLSIESRGEAEFVLFLIVIMIRQLWWPYCKGWPTDLSIV